MLKIRLQRVGKKHEPVFRLVVCDSKNGVKSGNNLEVLGSYDPRDKNETRINGEKVNHWISKGAQISGTVNNLLIDKGVIKGKKINVLPKKTAPKKEEPVIEVPVEEPVSAPSSDVAKEEVIEAPKEEAVEETAIEERKEEIPAETISEEKPAE